MLETSFSILFYLKKRTGTSQEKFPVYLRLTVNGERKEIALQESCDLERWNKYTQRAKGTNETSKTLNAFLDSVEAKIKAARLRLIETSKPVSTDAIVNIITGHEEKPRMLLEIFQHHNNQLAALENIDFAPATVKRYDTTLSHTREFIKWKYNRADIEIQALTFDFVSDLEFYLKSVRKCNHNSSIKYIGNVRKIVNYCHKSGWLQRDPFFGFKMAKREVVREYLSDQEMQALREKRFEIDRLSQVRDIFLFSCYTGLAFVDVFQLTKSRIANGVDGKRWIFTARQKTDTPTRIPLLPQALEIIDKYKDHPRCIKEGIVLPVVSNQKMNAYLKEIADLCSITKPLTFHIARHTFATTVTLSNGVPIETVSKMLGHKSIRITQHYAKIIDKKVSDDMNILEQTLFQKASLNLLQI